MLIAARNAMMVKSVTPPPIPGARWVEYLEGGSLNSGIAFIDTGYTPNSTTKVVANMSIFSNQGYCGRFGNSIRFTFGYSSGQLYIAQGSHYYLGAFVQGKIYTFINDIPNRIVSVEGVVSATTSAESDWYSQLYPIYLFASNVSPLPGTYINGSVLDSNSSGQIRIYSCKFYDGQTLVRDFSPIAIGTTGVMYDRLGVGGMNPDGSARTDGLYFNRGTGSFIIGPDK